jgi:flagellar protein FlaJ
MVEIKRIPFVPLPLEKAVKPARLFFFLTSPLAKAMPSLDVKLIQAGIKMKAREYMAVAVFSSVFWFFLIFCLFTPLAVAVKFSTPLLISLPFSILLSAVAYFYITFYPNLLVIKRDKEIEKNIMFAIRHLFIQVRSGVSLFDGLVSVSKGDYGIISKELEECTKQIATGKEEVSVLEELAFKNPNLHFRRALWQIINSLRAGGDIGSTLELLAQNLSEEQKVKIRKYGSQLSPMALMYMMMAIILPTLGVTFMVIFSTFSGIVIPPIGFYMIVFVLAVFQFMFIGMIKSRRPSVEV